MDVSSFRTLFAYNVWANHQALAAAARLTPAQLVALSQLGHSPGDLDFIWSIAGVITMESPCFSDQGSFIAMF
jgi:uncharacterized damage-inducible protein DinB